MSEYNPKYDFKISKMIVFSGFLVLLGLLSVVLFVVGNVYNTDTGFWYDTPLMDNSYYRWHPQDGDSCEILQEKLSLFHPDGTNPIRFEILKAMFELRCEDIDLR